MTRSRGVSNFRLLGLAARRGGAAVAIQVGLLMAAAAAPVCAREATELPNVVIVFTDDQGYADVGVFGAEGFETPHLDRMAAEGMRFTDWYVTQAVCSASRAGLLTGCYPNRVGILGALGPSSTHGIHADEVTLAELLRSRGYATAIFGKWHLGHHRQFLPLQHGFDEYFGLPYSNDMWPLHPAFADLPSAVAQRKQGFPDLPLLEGNRILKPAVTGEDQAQLTTWYTQRAVDFIQRQRDRPFFLYLPHSMPHVPLFVSDKFKGRSEQGLYGDVMMEIDWSLGQILQALQDQGLDEKTLVIFTTDNGPWLSYGDHAGSALPLREGKGTMFDGGCRTPCIMRWPGKIPAGAVCREVAATIDILPTLARLTGAELPAHKIDGQDIGPLMTAQPGAQSPHEAYYGYWGDALQTVRSGRWKLHFPHPYQTLGRRPGGKGGRPAAYQQARIELSLFDLEGDIGETTDVKDQHPEVVRRLQQLAERAREDLGDGSRRGSGRRSPGRLRDEAGNAKSQP